MRGFHTISAKLGNMRKVAEFVIYPIKDHNPEKVVIQSDNRICEVEMATGKAKISDGKGGHQGMVKLMAALGAKEIEVPVGVMEELRRIVKEIEPGPAVIVVGK